MSNAGVAVAGLETRQAMIRVWMAISGIWVAFWISIAAVIVITGGEMGDAMAAQLRLFAIIVLAPPVVLLAVGVLFRLGFEFFRRRDNA
jgi:hypothetical protein